MMSLPRFTMSFFALLLPVLAAQGGTMISSGLLPVVQEPGFYGAAPVQYCVNATENFSLDLASARRVIRQALDAVVADVRAPRTRKLVSGQLVTQSLTFVETACSPSTELVFSLGSIDTAVAQDLSGYETFLLTEQDGVNPQTGRNHVEIWVAPDLVGDIYFKPFLNGARQAKPIWKDETRFRNTVTHEIGHLMGFGHDSTSVMSVDVLESQVRAKPVRLAPLP